MTVLTYSRDYTGVPVLEPPQLVLVRMPDYAKCQRCGADAVATLRASGAGYSMGTDHLHIRSCPEISCPHGKLHGDSCEPCDAAEEAEQAAKEAARKAPLPLEEAVESIIGWAYTDSRVELDQRQLRQCLVDDIGATGTALPTEDECQEFICGDADGEVTLALKARFPTTDAWLEEQLT